MLDFSALPGKVPNQEQLRAWLGLWRAPKIGPMAFYQILQRFPDLCQFFNAYRSQSERPKCSESLHKYLQQPDWAGVDRDLAWLQGEDCHILSIFDSSYPKMLRNSPSPPPLLFVRGNKSCLRHWQLAMVGSRKPTPSGLELAFDFAKQLSRCGLIIVSGLALGIDTASHRGALAEQANTVAVLGTGIDKVYPRLNYALAHQIAEQGALVSEFPTGVPPDARHFPRRNRIIAGLSVGTLVVEATIRSGSLITARCAMEAGREVLAIPGSVNNTQSRGCHHLIQQGAKLVMEVADVMVELPEHVSQSMKKCKKDIQIISEEGFLQQIGYEITSIDTLISRTGLSFAAIMTKLLSLELSQRIQSLPGGYIRVK